MTGRRLRVQICNERFLSRFGVDRILALAGRFFEAHDLDVSYRCLQYSPEVIDPAHSDIGIIPVPPGLDIRRTEQLVAKIVLASWLKQKPDVLVVGGWPFFEAAARAASVGVANVFIDAGAVPHDGLEGHGLWPQLELRRVRQTFLPKMGRILPISEFIRDSQTLSDRGYSEGVRVVLLGSDHLTSASAKDMPTSGDLLEQIRNLRHTGHDLLLNLGRFEDRGYKNSPRFFDVVAGLKERGRKIVGLVLADPDEIAVPAAARRSVMCLGKPNDADMLAIMSEVQLGVTMSLWEGFNLPLVEMQNLGKPVLAFNLAAHPEVVAHSWQLCRDIEDMVVHAAAILDRDPIFERLVRPRLASFPGRLPWADTLAAWLDEIRTLARTRVSQNQVGARRLLFVDVSNSVRDNANSGVVRVTRQLTRRLRADDRFDLIFVQWDHALRSYVPIQTGDTHLSSYGGPTDVIGPLTADTPPQFALDILGFGRDPHAPAPPIALIPEVILDGSMGDRLRWLRYRGFTISMVLHDLIPIYHPQYCHADVVSGFASYIAGAQTADQCISVSRNTLADFLRFCDERRARRPSSLSVVWSPAQLNNLPRVTKLAKPELKEIRILCVSTIEPRKNHRKLLDAYLLLAKRRPDLSLRLVLVGNSYIGGEELLASITQATEGGAAIDWIGVVDDEELARQYRLARFTVYPSLVEGFGLPILESLWLGRPCICSSTGVMAELAKEGGCLMVDVMDAVSLSSALERLATDDALHRELGEAALRRNLTTWDDHARRVGDTLAALGDLGRHPPDERRSRKDLLNHAGSRASAYIEQMLDGHPIEWEPFRS